MIDRRSYIKYYRLHNRHNYSISNFIGYFVDKNATSLYDLSFLNPTVIPSVIFLVYTKESYMSAYLRTCFNIELILSIMLFVKFTCHCSIWILFFIL
jgi:hypothetical protein